MQKSPLTRFLIRFIMLVVVLWPACELMAIIKSDDNSDKVTYIKNDEPVPYPCMFVIDEMPELIGGMNAIYAELNYPTKARKNNIQSRIIVQFQVDEQGNVIKPHCLGRKIGYGLEEEAIRVINAMTFSAGRHQGIPVKMRMSIPIKSGLR